MIIISPSRLIRFLFIALLPVWIGGVIILFIFSILGNGVYRIPPEFIWLFAGTTVTAFTFILLQVFESGQLPIGYHVAIIGFPRSGKTTLITTLFAEIFARRITDISATLTGASTIDRVNADMRMMQMGHALGPTTDQDLFAYRTRVRSRQGIGVFRRTYNVEFGDFPGEDSVKYSELYGDWLHTTPFFKWVASAEAFIFIVDLERCYAFGSKDYVARMSSAIRAAWQHLLENHDQKVKQVRSSPLILVFTKTDLLTSVAKTGFLSIEDELRLPPVEELDPLLINSLEVEILRSFDELIKYLGSESRSFHVIFTSCFGTVNYRRLGISELLHAVFPK